MLKESISLLCHFATAGDLNYLYAVDSRYCDRSFAHARKVFIQFYTVQDLVEGRMLPLAFALAVTSIAE